MHPAADADIMHDALLTLGFHHQFQSRNSLLCMHGTTVSRFHRSIGMGEYVLNMLQKATPPSTSLRDYTS